jgi:GIY-YIG catalytic domain
MPWVIYCHTHVESGRRYVGLTKTSMLSRWVKHVYQANKADPKRRSHFSNAIAHHGKDAFSHEVLETCETLEDANAAEERWIEELGTRNLEKGFNLMKGGGSQPHPLRKNPWNDPSYREKCMDASRRRAADPVFFEVSFRWCETRSRESGIQVKEIKDLQVIVVRSDLSGEGCRCHCGLHLSP